MPRIDVIATTISGSISDWKKVKQIIPLFAKHGYSDVTLHEVDSHEEARRVTCDALKAGGKIPISAGGSGTFRAVLEGCMDSEVELSDIRLGFLRKGSADLIGKVLNMPDNIEDAIVVFAESISSDTYMQADILKAASPESKEVPRHFIGYGGAEIFGRVPYYTESRYTKYYKGILSQFMGDLGPFSTGMLLSLMEKIIKSPFRKTKRWQIIADGKQIAEGSYQALVLVNGYLGPDLAFSNQPLGSGEFYLFGIQNRGTLKLFSQVKRARNGSIVNDPQRWGFESFCIKKTLELIPDCNTPFPINVDGGTFIAQKSMLFERVSKISLIKKMS